MTTTQRRSRHQLERVRNAMHALWTQKRIHECLRNIPLLIEKLEQAGPDFQKEWAALTYVASSRRHVFTGYESINSVVLFDLPAASAVLPTMAVNRGQLFWLPPRTICLDRKRGWVTMTVGKKDWDDLPAIDLLGALQTLQQLSPPQGATR